MISANHSDQLIESRRGEFLLSTDPERLDVHLIHGFLTEGYWAKGIPFDVVARSVENSLCFGVYAEGKQVGFARVISDFATYAYIGDVFVLEPFRGRGLGKWMMECVMKHPRLQGLRRWSLATSDAHGLYAKFGFAPPRRPECYMEIYHADVYQSDTGTELAGGAQ
ncbi:MAG TPA: GNAT family N-acetyltransferase [Terriglobales bacterium]|nr:GNAT family N-acetyltransferase [Terriglobales bacterium]